MFIDRRNITSKLTQVLSHCNVPSAPATVARESAVLNLGRCTDAVLIYNTLYNTIQYTVITVPCPIPRHFPRSQRYQRAAQSTQGLLSFSNEHPMDSSPPFASNIPHLISIRLWNQSRRLSHFPKFLWQGLCRREMPASKQ